MAEIKAFPKDDNGKTVELPSRLTIFAAPAMDGLTFKPITLPTDSKSIKIQAGNGVAGDFTSFAANPPTFHFSLKETPSPGEWTQHVGELNFDCVALIGTTVGYVRAATSSIISVTVGA